MTAQQQPTRSSDHRYSLEGHTFAASITGVLSWSKSPAAMAAIKACQADWEDRGVTVHRSLELWANGEPDDVLQPLQTGPYRDWIEPLLKHPIWDHITITGSERISWCLHRNIAGTFDLSYRHPQEGHILADLKTRGRPDSGTYDVRPQLGGYLALEASQGRFYDGARAIWCRPGSTRLGELHSPRECLEAWAAAVATWRALGCP